VIPLAYNYKRGINLAGLKQPHVITMDTIISVCLVVFFAEGPRDTIDTSFGGSVFRIPPSFLNRLKCSKCERITVFAFCFLVLTLRSPLSYQVLN
jgi:hypothetical protein